MITILDTSGAPREVTSWAADEIISLRQKIEALELENYNLTLSAYTYQQDTTETARLFWIEKNQRIALEAKLAELKGES